MNNSVPFTPAEIGRTPGDSVVTPTKKVLNNLFFYFLDETDHQRSNITKLGLMDTPFSVFQGDLSMGPKKVGQTPREFYAAIDATVAALGIKREDLEKVIHDFIEGHRTCHRNEEDWVYDKLWNMMLPIYLALRAQGYTSFDITA